MSISRKPIVFAVLLGLASLVALADDRTDTMAVSPMQAFSQAADAYTRNADRLESADRLYEVITITVDGRGPDQTSTMTLFTEPIEGSRSPRIWLTLGDADPLGVLIERRAITVVRTEHPDRALAIPLGDGQTASEILSATVPPIALPQLHLAMGRPPAEIFPHAGAIQWMAGEIDLTGNPDIMTLTGVSDTGSVTIAMSTGASRVLSFGFTTHDAEHRIRLSVRRRTDGDARGAESAEGRRAARRALPPTFERVTTWVGSIEDLWDEDGESDDQTSAPE